MIRIEQFGIALVDKKGNILGIARPSYGKYLIFTTLTEDYEKSEKIVLFDSEDDARRSFTGRVSKESYRLSEDLAKLITDEYHMKLDITTSGVNTIQIKEFSDIKSIFKPVRVNVTYELC